MHPNRFHFSSVGKHQINTPSACWVKVYSRSLLQNVVVTHPQTSVVVFSALCQLLCFNASLTVTPTWVAFIPFYNVLYKYATEEAGFRCLNIKASFISSHGTDEFYPPDPVIKSKIQTNPPDNHPVCRVSGLYEIPLKCCRCVSDTPTHLQEAASHPNVNISASRE